MQQAITRPASPDLAAVIAASPTPYLLLDRDLMIVAVSDTYLDATQTRRDDIVGRTVFGVFPAHPLDERQVDLETARKSFRSVLETGQKHAHPMLTYAIPRSAARGGGFEERFWRTLNSPVFGPDGDVQYVLHMAEDITDAVRQWRTSGARLRNALAVAGIAPWDYDIDTGTIELAAAFDVLFGFQPGSGPHPAGAVVERIHADDLDMVRSQTRHALTGADGTSASFDFRVERPDGTTCWLLARCEVVRDRPSSHARLVGVIKDVTADRQRAAAAAAALAEREAWREQQNRLVQDATHRIQNNLQLVTSVLRLQARAITDPAVRRQFDMAASRVRAITAIHERPSRGDGVESVDIGACLTALCEDIAAAFIDNRSLWSIEVAADRLHLPVELSVPIALVVNELVTNVIRHAYPGQPGGAILVSVGVVPAGALHLCVADRGVGRPCGQIGKTLGSRLIESFARQLGAVVRREDASPGLRVTLVIPYAPGMEP